MKSTIKVALALFAIAAAVGLFAASAVVTTNTVEAFCKDPKKTLTTPGHEACVPDNKNIPNTVPPS